MSWCILIPLLVGAICALLGYLLGKLLGGGSNHEDSNDRIAKLESDLAACRASKNAGVASSFAAAGATAIAFDSGAAKAVFGKTIKQDDLTVVEGIGPKIQELFHNHDVKTWRSLSECSVDKCQQVLDSGGERFKVHKPGTWPEQAKMAYEGRWEALLKWQDELDGGK
jgi:predicted flap endonuclease-1-like 5' DNA nuclease